MNHRIVSQRHDGYQVKEVILKDYIIEQLKKIAAASPENELHKKVPEKAWGEPIIGFAKGDDPIFDQLKDHIGDFYWTPPEAYKLAFPKDDVKTKNLTVISCIFPQTKKTKEAHGLVAEFPAENWVRSRYYWDAFAKDVAEQFIASLEKQGIKAVAPVMIPQWSRVHSEKHNYSSKWSERHTGYACGLGTFGYSEGLITSVGKAIRALSFIVNIPLAPTVREYQAYNEYCLYYAKGICKKCIQRCPSGALTDKGHDKDKCDAYAENLNSETLRLYNTPNLSCGFCQTNVPCQSQIPLKIGGKK